MTPVSVFAGRCVAVFGLGASGRAAAHALTAGGAEIAAWDDGEAGRAAATAAGLPLCDLTAADWGRFAALVLAPGVPLTHPEPHWTVHRAKAAGVEIIGDVELFCRERAAICPDAPFVAVTGTNGKSTTTALIAHILRGAGRDVQMGGNIGVPILSLAPPARNRVHVIETSSFQIDLAPSLAPTVGVLLNVTPDHLDRHGTMEAYADLKGRIVMTAGHAVVGLDDPWCHLLLGRRNDARPDDGADHRTPVSVTETLSWGCWLDGEDLVYKGVRRAYDYATPQPGRFLVEAPRETVRLSGIRSLRGVHNAQNACAAYAAVRALGVPHRPIAHHIATYPGLPHRLEEIGHVPTAGGRVLLVNDSKATNADSAEKALASFPGDIFWILGGKPKEGGIDSLRPYFPKIAKAYLIGVAAEAFAETIGEAIPVERCGTMDVAVARAVADAAASGAREPVVLLSPACASFDQYPNFERRGEAFRALCLALPGVQVRS